jgi:putative ABC transport system permease protein
LSTIAMSADPIRVSLLPLLLIRFTLRHWRHAFGQNILLVLILALGVGVFTAVRLANRAAVSSFTHFTETLTGSSDWIIQAPAGSLPESILPELRDALADLAVQIHPVIESTASEAVATNAPPATVFGRRTYTLLGVDLIGVSNLAAQQAAAQSFFGRSKPDPKSGPTAPVEVDFWSLFRDGPQVWASPALAAEKRPGTDSLNLIVNERLLSLPVAGLIPQVPDGPAAPANLLVLDLPQLQRLVGREGQVDRVEFILEAGHALDARRIALGERLAALGRTAAGERWLATTPGARRETAATMTQAFRLNLTVLSLIALLVGLYLVFQALDGAVVRRRGEIAVLRSLGFDAGALRRAWLVEAALLGLAGGALGLLFGWLGAQVAVRAVGQTVNALYYATSVSAAQLAWPEAALSLAAGVVASIVAGWAPARAASLTPPAQILVRGAPGSTGARWLRSWPLAIGSLALGALLVKMPPLALAGGNRFPIAGHIAALCGIVGGGVLAALAIPISGRVLRPFAASGAPWRVALGHIRRPTGRHRLAAAALVCAIGMAAGMAILVASFERSVRTWINTALQADLYLSSQGAQSASSNNRIAAGTWQAIAAHPAVARTALFNAYPIQLNGLPTTLGGTDLAAQNSRGGFMWVEPPASAAVFDPEQNAGTALVSESFGERFRVCRGDSLSVPTPLGSQRLTVAAVFADFGNERGTILVDRRHAVRWFGGDEHATSLSLDLVPGVQPETIRAALLAANPGLAIYTNVALRGEVLRIFRQTFSITYALEAIGVIVAVVGLALTLVSVLLDRRDELTTLRALGFRRSEIARATAIEGGVLALCATLSGLTLSFALGWVLIYVINKQSFGWTLALAVPLGQLAALSVLVVGTGVVVSYFVGRWGAILPADREE